MKAGRFILGVGAMLVGVSCTNGAPSFTVLDQGAIPQPRFDGQTTTTVTLTSAYATSTISGQCDPRIRSIGVRVTPGGATGDLAVLSVGAPAFACQTSGTFSFTLKTLTDLVGTPVANQTYQIELRATTAGGVSNASVISLVYTREVFERWRLTGGATESGATGPRLATSSHFGAEVRVGRLVGAGDANADGQRGIARSPSFVFKRGRAAR